LKLHAERVAHEIGSEKFEPSAGRQTHGETFALLPSFLQGNTSIYSVVSNFSSHKSQIHTDFQFFFLPF
jgi:hypothetical protein